MLPTLFVSHGSPMHALHAGRAGALWQQLGRELPRPRAILMVSAHWETELPMAGTSARPETIHDFGGFPPELYRMRYPAPGAPEAAQRAVELLKQAGIPASTNGCRGIDHGAWVPLLYMYPDADVPVAQLSVQTSLGAPHHLRVGQALAPLALENVLVIGSGHMTHNLRELMMRMRNWGGAPDDQPPEPYVDEFRGWVDAALQQHDNDKLARYRELAPHAVRAHPTDEHFLPLLVAYAAAGPDARVEHLDAGVDARVLALDAYRFWPRAAN
jgi:4,5-DOPA dioxygenase extradiol